MVALWGTRLIIPDTCVLYTAQHPCSPIPTHKILTRISKYSGELRDPREKFLLMSSQCGLVLRECESYTTSTVAQRTVKDALGPSLLSVAVMINTMINTKNKLAL